MELENIVANTVLLKAREGKRGEAAAYELLAGRKGGNRRWFPKSIAQFE